MKTYFKDIDGQRVYKSRKQIVIEKDGMNTYNPTEELILADGWQEYVYIDKELTLEDVKKHKIEEINYYDQSSDVNIFYVNDMPIWLDKATRSGLMLRFQAEAAIGKTNTSLWYDGVEFPLEVSIAMQMLYALEVYASACYDNTQKHISEVNKLETKEEIDNYDYTIGYPEKLRF